MSSEYPDQRRERDVHKRQSADELLSNDPGDNLLYTQVIEQIRKLSPSGVKILVNPLKQVDKTTFFVAGLPSEAILKRLKRRLQRDGFEIRSHSDFPSYFEVRWQ